MVFNYVANIHFFFELCKFSERNPKNQWNFWIIIQKFGRNFGLGRFYEIFYPYKLSQINKAPPKKNTHKKTYAIHKYKKCIWHKLISKIKYYFTITFSVPTFLPFCIAFIKCSPDEKLPVFICACFCPG